MDFVQAWWPSHLPFSVTWDVQLESVQLCIFNTQYIGRDLHLLSLKDLNMPKLLCSKSSLIQVNWEEGNLNLLVRIFF